MKSMEDQAKKWWPARQWWKEVPDGPKGQQEEEQERQVGCRLVFQNYSFDFREAVPEKKCSSKLIHGMMKNANVYPKEGWETGKM